MTLALPTLTTAGWSYFGSYQARNVSPQTDASLSTWTDDQGAHDLGALATVPKFRALDYPPEPQGRPCVKFFGQTNEGYQSTGTAANYKFLSDGTPWMIGLWFRQLTMAPSGNYVLLDTGGSSNATVGICIQFETTNNAWRVKITDGSTTILNAVFNSLAIPPYCQVLLMKFDGTTLTVYVNSNSSAGTATKSGSFSSSNPAFALKVGYLSGSAFVGEIGGIVIATGSGAVNSTDVNAVYYYMECVGHPGGDAKEERYLDNLNSAGPDNFTVPTKEVGNVTTGTGVYYGRSWPTVLDVSANGDGTSLRLFSQNLNSSGVLQGCATATSTDGGATWTDPNLGLVGSNALFLGSPNSMYSITDATWPASSTLFHATFASGSAIASYLPDKGLQIYDFGSGFTISGGTLVGPAAASSNEALFDTQKSDYSRTVSILVQSDDVVYGAMVRNGALNAGTINDGFTLVPLKAETLFAMYEKIGASFFVRDSVSRTYTNTTIAFTITCNGSTITMHDPGASRDLSYASATNNQTSTTAGYYSYKGTVFSSDTVSTLSGTQVGHNWIGLDVRSSKTVVGGIGGNDVAAIFNAGPATLGTVDAAEANGISGVIFLRASGRPSVWYKTGDGTDRRSLTLATQDTVNGWNQTWTDNGVVPGGTSTAGTKQYEAAGSVFTTNCGQMVFVDIFNSTAQTLAINGHFTRDGGWTSYEWANGLVPLGGSEKQILGGSLILYSGTRYGFSVRTNVDHTGNPDYQLFRWSYSTDNRYAYQLGNKTDPSRAMYEATADANSIYINADCSLSPGSGVLTVALKDAQGNVIAGHDHSDCNGISGTNETSKQMIWGGHHGLPSGLFYLEIKTTGNTATQRYSWTRAAASLPPAFNPGAAYGATKGVLGTGVF